MAYYVITYDERTATHDYGPLYDLLNRSNAAHLQNSVWLLESSWTAAQVRDGLKAVMHPGDTIAVLRLTANPQNWAALNARPEGVAWLRAHLP